MPGNRQPYCSHDNYACRIRTLCTARHNHPRVTKLIEHQHARHATSHTPTQHASISPSRQRDGPQSQPHGSTQASLCTACTAECTAHHTPHIAHRTPHTAHRTPHRTPRQLNDRPRHTRRYRATLTEELPGCPASTGCCRRVGRSRTRTSACRTHEQLSHHTMAPDAARALCASPATPSHRNPSHSINHIYNTNCSHPMIKTSAVCASDSDTKHRLAAY
jgi:hypothetical protein